MYLNNTTRALRGRGLRGLGGFVTRYQVRWKRPDGNFDSSFADDQASARDIAERLPPGYVLDAITPMQMAVPDANTGTTAPQVGSPPPAASSSSFTLPSWLTGSVMGIPLWVILAGGGAYLYSRS